MNEVIISFAEFQAFVKNISAPCLYRGQANALHPLIPGIGRSHPQYKPTKELEKALFLQFKNRAIPHIKEPKPESNWDWLVTAQHHGLKTRLLDWTTDWRVALYFACLPHDDMYRVPFSIFVLQRPKFTSYESLPQNIFSFSGDYYFQPPHLNDRIPAQAGYLSVHKNPYQPVREPRIRQFSLYPFPPHRREIAQFLADERITAAEMIPGLDGICRSLIEEPRITAQIELPVPTPPSEGCWRRIPARLVGKRFGKLRPMMLRKPKLSLILDLFGGGKLIGIPCFLDKKPFGYLKYVNLDNTELCFLGPKGDRTIVVHDTDLFFERLTISKKHMQGLMPEEPIFARRIKN